VFAKPISPPPTSLEPKPVPIVVRTLKDPPEIWDLVQEAPRKFDARAAFFARMGSFKGRLIMTVTLLVLMGVAVGLSVYLSRERSVNKPAPATITATVPRPVVNQTSQPASTLPETPSLPAQASVPMVTSNSRTRRSRSFSTPTTVETAINNEQPSVETNEVNVIAPLVVERAPETRPSAAADTKKAATPLNSQTLLPAKTTQPKAKVIQWP
jgi:hypothetical protein